MTEQASFEEIEAFIQQFQKKSKQEEKKDFLTELFKDINFIDETPNWALHPPKQEYIDKEYLQKRGFDVPKEIEKEIITNLKYANQKLNTDFTIKELSNEEDKKTIRSKIEDEEISKIQNIIIDQSIKLDKQYIHLPRLEEFDFNRDLETDKFNLTHIAIDTEADHHSELILSQVYNLEAQRLVLCLLDDEYSIKIYTQPDQSQIIYMTSPNPNDAILIGDAETVISSILITALQQGHKQISFLFKEIQEKNILPTLNFEIFKELMYDERRTLYILHNSSYDVEQLKTAHRNAKKQLYAFQNLSKPEKIKITNIYSDDKYKLHLGNIPLGFRYSLSAQKVGWKKRCKINIAPAQAEAYPLTFLCDTMILAFAFQEKSAKLKNLSKGTKYEKTDLSDENKIFSKKDLYNFIEKDHLTDEMKYSIFDVFSTIAVYEKMTKNILFNELEHIFDIKLKRTTYPFCCKIYSTATISKFILIQFLEQKNHSDRYKIQDNIKKVRKLQQNFEKTYLGGKVSAYVHGLVKSTAKMIIFYLDFASLYPHVAWIIEAEFLYLICSQNNLHKYLHNNIQEAIIRLKKSINEILDCVINTKPLQKETFQRIVGNCTIYSNIPLQLPRRYKNKRTEIQVTGRITTTLPDLTVAIVRYSLKNKISLSKIFNQINFIKVEYIKYPFLSKYGKEFFTKLYLTRSEIKKAIKKIKNKETINTEQLKHAQEILNRTLEKVNNNEISEQNAIIIFSVLEKFAKYVMNSSYGVAGEGISNEDFTGILFNPIIANAITSVARAFTSIAEIKTRLINALPLYTDTDSIIIRATLEQKKSLLKIFSETIELKDEIEDQYPNKNIIIKQAYISGKKKYALELSNGEIYFKSHGKGQYEKEKFNKALETAYRYIFNSKFTQLTITEASKRAVKEHGYLQDVHLDSSKSSIYKGLIKFNTKTITAYTFHVDNIPYYVKYNRINDNYLITNVKTITKGLFGKYLSIGTGKHKLTFFISIPVDVEKIIHHFIELFYHEGMDIIFKRIMKKDKWQQFYDYIYQRLQDYQIEGSYDFDKSDITEYFAYNFKKLCKFLNLDYEKQIKKEMLNILEHFTDYQNINYVFQQIAPQKLVWYFSGNDYNFIEEKMLNWYEQDFLQEKSIIKTYTLYKKIFTQIKKKESLNEILNEVREKKIAEFQGIEDRLLKLKETITKKEHIRKRLEKYFNYDRNKIMRDIDKYNETYKTTKVFQEKIKDEPIQNISTNLHKKIKTDGFSYHITIPIPTLRFSNEIKANLDKYYSKNILNTSISASKIYYATHGKEQFRLTKQLYAECHNDNDELYNKIIYSDPKQLPCPKLNTKILIPLLFKVKPILNKENQLLKHDYDCLNPQAQEELKKVITKTHSNYFEVNLKKYQKWEEKEYKTEWQEIFIGNQRFSVSIEKYTSSKYNATMLINILPEKQGYGKRRFITATIRINPLSFNLVNINLYTTTIHELIKTENEILKLIRPLLLDNDIHLFTRNQSLTFQDAKEKASFWRNLTYIVIMKNIIREKLKYASVKLTEMTISEQKKIKCDTDLFMSLLQTRIIKKYHQTESNYTADKILKYQKSLSVYPHKASRGISMNNFNHNYAISIYAKDKRWLQSKTMRIGEKRQLTQTQMKEILRQRINPKLIRYEQALFGMDAILRFNFLNEIAKMIEETEKAVNKIEHDYNLAECYQSIDTNIPSIYYNPNFEITEFKPPPDFNAL